MRYSLLDFLVCPETRSELVCVVTKETPGEITHVRMNDGRRVNQPGAAVGPLPSSAHRTQITEFLAPLASAPADAARNYGVRVREGLLIAPDTGRWYPVREFIPEVLPDHLRNLDNDFQFLQSIAPLLPPGLFDLLNNRDAFKNADQSGADIGISHKIAEMTITEKVTEAHFFGPGYVAPFNPGATEHTMHLLRLFSLCMPLFWNGSRRIILDAGCGYSWTTDWMFRMGMEPIGIDISRVYLEIAVARLGHQLPHVLVADTEQLPIAGETLDGVLGFDAFHHIPNRNGAMSEFERTLKPGGLVVLAEPPSAHEHVPAVQDVMRKYGTLEKGMDLADVQEYVRNTGLAAPVQHHILKVEHASAGGTLSQSFLQQHSFNPANLFTIEKKPGLRQPGGDDGSRDGLEITAGRQSRTGVLAQLWKRLTAGRTAATTVLY